MGLKKLLKNRNILEEEIEDYDYMNAHDYSDDGEYEDELYDAHEKLDKVNEQILKALEKEVARYGGTVTW